MYLFKHPRENIKNCKVRKSSFRTWKKGKKWLYGSMSVVLLIGNLTSPFIPFLNHQSKIVHAATNTTSQLVAGTAISNPNLASSISSAQSMWGTNVGNNSPAWQSNNQWWDSNVSGSNTWAYLPFGKTLNMGAPFTMSYGIKSYGTYSDGVYFVPAGTTATQIQNSISSTTTGPSGTVPVNGGLGISGIPNAVFAGRDTWYDKEAGDSIAYGNTGTGIISIVTPQITNSYQGRIATTNSSGVLNPSLGSGNNSVTAAIATSNTVSTPIFNAGANTSSAGESWTLSWTPTTPVTAGATTVRGTLTVGNGNGSMTYTNLVMQTSMQMGINVLNNGNSSLLSGFTAPSLNITGNTITGNTTAPITVNYKNTLGNTIAPSSTITSNVGDTVGVVGTTTPSDTNLYDYQAPAISGYTYSSTTGLTNNAVAASGNVINVIYTPTAANIAGSFAYVDGTPGFTNTAGLAGPLGNLTLNGSGTTATVTANVGDTITIKGTGTIATGASAVLNSSVAVSSTSNTTAVPFTAPSGYYIVGYSYAGGLPVALSTPTNSGGFGTTSFTATSQTNNTIQFYLAPFSGAKYNADGTLDTTTLISGGTSLSSIWKMTNTAGTTSANAVYAANGAQPRVILETTTGSGTPTLGVTSASTTYKMYTGTGLSTTAPVSATLNAPTQFIASQGQAYSSMQGVTGTNKFPTTNTTLAIPGYKIVSVRRSNNTNDISQTAGITQTGMSATTNFSSMEAALAGNDAYYNFPPNPVDFTTTNAPGSATINQFVVLYQAIPATLNVNNLTYSVGNMPSTNPNISTLLTAALQSTSTNSDGSAATVSNLSITNITNVGTGNSVQAGQLSSQPAGLYQVTYQYTDPLNGTQVTTTGYVNLINGVTTNIPYVGAASLTNTLNLGLTGSLTPTSESVGTISYTDVDGNAQAPDITASDIVLDNQGNLTIAEGKLHQGTYTIKVTYSYSNGMTATVTDTINVAGPFVLPFTGGEGMAGVVSLAAFAGFGAIFLRKRKKSEEEENFDEINGFGTLKLSDKTISRNLHRNLRTRPYKKLFHTKSRVHLSQSQQKRKRQ